MKTKLEMAHEYAVAMLRTPAQLTGMSDKDIAIAAFNLAEAMQAEADKRLEEAEYKEEWQPDWSQAPEWAKWWAMDLDLVQAHWYEVEPSIDAITWRRRTRTCRKAPSFGYIGDWRDSLRKRSN